MLGEFRFWVFVRFKDGEEPWVCKGGVVLLSVCVRGIGLVIVGKTGAEYGCSVSGMWVSMVMGFRCERGWMVWGASGVLV